MKKVILNNNNYEIMKDDNSIYNQPEIEEKFTDYFDDYDYIFGDYAYDKLRLKGFFDNENKKVKEINNIKNLDSYIENYCAYGAKWFLLKKVK